MKNSLKFIAESKDNLKLLNELDSIINTKESKDVEELNSLFNKTMYKVIKAGIKSIDFDKLSASAKNLLVGFISGLKPKEDVNAKEILNKILSSYASKRRGEEISETFDQIRQSFKDCVKKMIESGDTDFQPDNLSPFAKELFDKYTEYKYLASQPNGDTQAFSTLKKLKDSKIEYKECKLLIVMKESEKKIGNFGYHHQWFKGKGSEGKSIEQFILSTDLNMDLYLDKNILEESFKESSFYIRPSKDNVYRINESVMFMSPNSEFNVTSMPSWIKSLDKGKISILESTELEKRIELAGDSISGVFIANRKDENSDFWNLIKEAKHSHDKCMECSKTPEYEILWAEGKGHAWFCEGCLKKWSKSHKEDIDYIKEVKDGMAASKFAENSNHNIKDKIKLF